MPMRSLTWVFFVTAALVIACGSSAPSLHWASYSHNCVVSSDCVAIGVAEGCVCPLCNNRAINLVDEQQYQMDAKQYAAACKGTACSNISCPVVTAFCDTTGTCDVH
jgi:hypothetical protein